jgi:hypothetical protein
MSAIEAAVDYFVTKKFGFIAALAPALATLRNERNERNVTLDKNAEIEAYKITLRNMPESELLTLHKRALQEAAEITKQAAIREEQKRFYNLASANADFVHWSKAAYWTMDEAIALSFGKEPGFVTWQKIEWVQDKTEFAKNYAKRRDLVKRAVAAKKLTEPVLPIRFLTWANEVNIELPPALISEVEKLGTSVINWEAAYRKLKAEFDALAQKLDVKPESTRKMENLLQAFAAIAIDAYGYDPEAVKSTAPTDIARALQQHGKEVDPKTIRTWLKEGKTLLG